MVSVAVSKLRCTELIFVQPRTKVNGAYYWDELLAKHMLPAIRQIAEITLSSSRIACQAASASFSRHRRLSPSLNTAVHHPRLVATKQPRSQPGRLQDVGRCTPAVRGSCPLLDTWLKNWRCRTECTIHDDLRPGLPEATSDCRVVRSAASIVDDAVDQWRKRLRYCMETSGRHCEHLL